MYFKYLFRRLKINSIFRFRSCYSLLNTFTTEFKYNYWDRHIFLGSLGTFVLLSSSKTQSDSRASLPRNFVSDAAEIASPSVVNILCPVQGMMISGVSTGSGFIISKVFYHKVGKYFSNFFVYRMAMLSPTLMLCHNQLMEML
jgi:S1-C subfamily serine protease